MVGNHPAAHVIASLRRSAAIVLVSPYSASSSSSSTSSYSCCCCCQHPPRSLPIPRNVFHSSVLPGFSRPFASPHPIFLRFNARLAASSYSPSFTFSVFDSSSSLFLSLSLTLSLTLSPPPFSRILSHSFSHSLALFPSLTLPRILSLSFSVPVSLPRCPQHSVYSAPPSLSGCGAFLSRAVTTAPRITVISLSGAARRCRPAVYACSQTRGGAFYAPLSLITRLSIISWRSMARRLCAPNAWHH